MNDFPDVRPCRLFSYEHRIVPTTIIFRCSGSFPGHTPPAPLPAIPLRTFIREATGAFRIIPSPRLTVQFQSGIGENRIKNISGGASVTGMAIVHLFKLHCTNAPR
jgi:hypothetical protein